MAPVHNQGRLTTGQVAIVSQDVRNCIALLIRVEYCSNFRVPWPSRWRMCNVIFNSDQCDQKSIWLLEIHVTIFARMFAAIAQFFPYSNSFHLFLKKDLCHLNVCHLPREVAMRSTSIAWISTVKTAFSSGPSLSPSHPIIYSCKAYIDIVMLMTCCWASNNSVVFFFFPFCSFYLARR